MDRLYREFIPGRALNPTEEAAAAGLGADMLTDALAPAAAQAGEDPEGAIGTLMRRSAEHLDAKRVLLFARNEHGTLDAVSEWCHPSLQAVGADFRDIPESDLDPAWWDAFLRGNGFVITDIRPTDAYPVGALHVDYGIDRLILCPVDDQQRLCAILAIVDPGSNALSAATVLSRMACTFLGTQLGRLQGDDMARRAHVLTPSAFSRMLEQGRIQVCYQPVLSSFSHRISSFEALARWVDPQEGVLLPRHFLPHLQTAHLMPQLDLYVLEQSCAALRRRVTAGLPWSQLSVNLSIQTLELPDLGERIRAIFSRYQIQPRLIAFEIDQQERTTHEQLIRRKIAVIHELGSQVWLDHYGESSSAPGALVTQEFDFIKIDGSLIRTVNTEKGRTIVLGLIDMIRRLGLYTVAEGVESAEQSEFLETSGCGLQQGFVHCEPLSEDELFVFLREKGLDMENENDHTFFQAIGKVNVLDLASIFRDGSDPEEQASPLPVTLFLLERGQIRTVYANDDAREKTERFQGFTLEQIDAMAADPALPFRGQILSCARIARTAGERTESEFYSEKLGRHLRMLMRCIASGEGRQAFLCAVTSISHPQERQGIFSDFQDLCSSFEDACILSPETDSFHYICGVNFFRTLQQDDLPLRQTLQQLLSNSAPGEDRDRLAAFLDPDTLSRRVKEAPFHVLNGFFRIIPGGPQSGALPIWYRTSISRVVDHGITERYLWAIYPSDSADAVRLYSQSADASSADAVLPALQDPALRSTLLWQALMEQSQAGMYWKDTQGRYLGANARFEEITRLPLEQFYGRSDQDLHWPVGARIIETKTGGETRRLVRAEFPVRQYDLTIGEAGILTDITRESALPAALPDTPQDLSDFYALSADFARRAQEERTDFACIVVQILGTAWRALRLGEEEALAALRQAGEILRKTLPDAVMGQITTGRFDLFLPCDDSLDLSALESDLHRALTSVRGSSHLDHEAFYAMIGSARFSETGDLDELTALAQSRLHTAGSLRALERSFQGMQFSEQTIRSFMRLYAPLFDTVRLVDPGQMQARELSRDGTVLTSAFSCTAFFNHEERCENCISLRAVREKRRQEKVEMVGDLCCHIVALYVLVNRRPCALECIQRIRSSDLHQASGENGSSARSLQEVEQRLRMQNRRLNQLSHTDALTGLGNRFGLRSDFEHYVGQDVNVCMLDIDHFKTCNDTLGHATGDLVLEEFASILREVFGSEGCYRYGGDEMLILSTLDREAFAAAVVTAQHRIHQLRVEGITWRLSASFGYVWGHAENRESLRQMIPAADSCLYRAKRNGRDCIECSSFEEARAAVSKEQAGDRAMNNV